MGKRLGERGAEFGSTTGRARRCGWFDAVAIRHAAQINSISGLCLTKLDVLDGLETLRICVDYSGPGGGSHPARFGAEYYSSLTPVYENLSGWRESTVGVKRINDLPPNALKYIRRIEEVTNVPIDIVSTGPDRTDTIVLRDPFVAPSR